MQKYIVKFFPEIMIKGSSAKRQMIGQLYNNITTILHRISKEITIKKFSDKIEVDAPKSVAKEALEALQNTPGVEQILEVLQFHDIQTLQDVKKKIGEVVTPWLKNKTFVVRAKRNGKHPFNSMDLERGVGGYLLAHSDAKKVDLHHPDITVEFELKDSVLSIITKRYKGMGGFPLGMQGDILSLMSGGFDSTIASYLTIKRGIKTHFLFFNLGGDAHEMGVKQVALYLWSKFASSHRVKFITVNFEDVVEKILTTVPKSYMGVMLKRLMLQTAESIAKKMQIDALVTGESVAQVSSQTLRNLALIDEACSMLVLRPLATMDKNEIIALASKIGTKEFAQSMPEYCGVISQNPVTHGSYKRMQDIALKFDYEVLEEAVKGSEEIWVDEIVQNVAEKATIEVVTKIDEDTIVVDIRDTKETLQSAVKIPFYKLKSEIPKLSKDKKIALYCDKGVMSRLHAQYLKDAGVVRDIYVYRKDHSRLDTP